MPQLNFWNDLPKNATEFILSHTRFREYTKGSAVYSTGENPMGIYLLRRGLVGLTTTTSKGTEHILRVFSQNSFFGHRALFADEPYYGTAICLEDSEVGLVPRRIVEETLASYPEANRILIKTLARELGLAETQRLKIADQEVLKRLAGAIVYLKEIHPGYRWTRSEIAHFCASTGPTIIRGLASLEQMGLVLQKGRDIQIRNRDKLIEFSQN